MNATDLKNLFNLLVTMVLITGSCFLIYQLESESEFISQAQSSQNMEMKHVAAEETQPTLEELRTHVTYRNQDDFISVLGSYAQEAKNHNIYPSVMIAQAILESGSDGSSELALYSKNLFGIKGTYQGQGQQWSTLEDEGGGQYYEIQDEFRHYNSYYESILDYLGKLTGEERYQQVVYATSPQEQVQLIKDAGYATDDYYVSKVIGVMETYNLYQYDL